MQGKRSRSKFTSQTRLQNSIQPLENSKNSSIESNPSLTIATIDGQWVKREEYIKALVELENRKMIGQAMHDCIVANELHYQSISLMALIKNWNQI